MSYRKEKLEEQIKRLVSELIIRELKDPRVGFITITSVAISDDYGSARIGVSVLGDAREMRKSMEGLNSACGFIQSRVGKAMRLRHTPRFEFFPDASIAEGVRMVDLLNKLEDESAPGGDTGTDETDGDGEE